MTSELAIPFIAGDLSAINDVDSRLAFELAAELSEIPDILSRYSLSREDLKKKLNNQQFQQIYKEYKAVWKSDLSIKERIRLKAQMSIEDSLLPVHRMIHDESLTASARMDAFKQMAKVATVDVPDKEGGGVGERINININIPGAEKPITYEGVVDAREEITDGA